MSAYVVANEHINALLTWARDNQVCWWPESNRDPQYLSKPNVLQEAAELLLAENIRSVCERYPDQTPEDYDPITFEEAYPLKGGHFSPIEILKACDGYDYQACETDDYSRTEAADLISRIRQVAIIKLPGYDDARTWEITIPLPQRQKSECEAAFLMVE